MTIDLSAPVAAWLPTVWYGGYLPDMPDLCVGRLPPEMRAGRASPWKIWIVESPRERKLLLRALEKPVALRAGAIDFRAELDAATGAPGRGDAFLGLYAPPAPDWPWITIGRWPPQIGAAMGGLARGVYSTETDDSEAAALDRLSRLGAMVSAVSGSGLPIRTPPRPQSQN